MTNGKKVIAFTQLVSLFLRRIVALVSSVAQGEITQVVITVPSGFSEAQQKSMAVANELIISG